VSFDCDTGPRDIIRHDIDGFLVAPGDAGAMEWALEKLMLDDGLRGDFASRAIEARERFSLKKISSMWEEVFATPPHRARPADLPVKKQPEARIP
jgi:glycosyltransferase involved in cell wall biosynthesis